MTGINFSAALLLDGETPSAQQLAVFLPPPLQLQLCWVAADGGCRHATKYQANLQVIVGDFDSVPEDFCASQFAGDKLRFCPDKDESDRNLALDYLLRHGHSKIVQIGGGGGRSDHFLAMIYDYQLQRASVLPKLWLTRCEAIFYLETGEQLELEFPVGSKPIISAFPLSSASRLESSQLKWPLDAVHLNEAVSLQDAAQGVAGRLPYSLSNWAEELQLSIHATHGAALIFCPYTSCHPYAEGATVSASSVEPNGFHYTLGPKVLAHPKFSNN